MSGITARAKEAAKEVDPHLALEFGLESDAVKGAYQHDRMSAALATLFGALALVLAAIGIYGVTSYATVQRTAEIGLRMALGAQRRDVLRLIVGESLRVVLIGVALGALGAFAVSGLIREMLFGSDSSRSPELHARSERDGGGCVDRSARPRAPRGLGRTHGSSENGVRATYPACSRTCAWCEKFGSGAASVFLLRSRRHFFAASAVKSLWVG